MNLSLPGYVIFRESGHDPKYILYRGVREKDQLPVQLKMLRANHPRLDDVSRLKNEYSLLKDLDFPTIIKAYGLEQHQNSYYLILEDTPFIPLEKLMRMRKLSISENLSIAINLVKAVSDLQAHDLIHKDIQPDNILVDPERLHVKLTGFNFATKIPRQRLSIKNPTQLEGTLAYISPEQTGRMNREIDYRTDFYSLGVTLYKLFTKELPFTALDPMELVHAHIAKTPIPPNEVKPEIPVPISDIILKLLSKKAEDRYSSTFSLLQDLETCAYEWNERGAIEPFPLRANDICGKLQILQKIYGRKKELDLLLSAFDEVAKGSTRLMLLSGYPGIGKTSIVNEIHKPILEKNGFFIAGKYDQYKANIPYSAFIEAFQDLIRQILTENDDTIAMWREKIKAALGVNAGVILEVVPELRLIVGDSIPLQEFDSQETQNRFNFFLQRFISLYASSSTPLVIFLDDLQWIDPASLQLLEMILTTLKTEGLFLIGAYRSNEVTPLHPLMTAIQRIAKNGTPSLDIEITPLTIHSVSELIADTLNTSQSNCKTLSELVFSKTHGNPFFINQLLTYLYEEKLLYVDTKDGAWAWDLEKIHALDVSDNVIDLLITKLQRCSPQMQKLLEVAACIGANFDMRLISTVTNQPLPEMMGYLMEALKEGFILPFEDIHNIMWIDEKEAENQQLNKMSYFFRFLHDKVQQACYQLMNAQERKNTHYQIGLLLLNKFRGEHLEEHIFEVMSQLNHANDQITELKERKEYAEMNLLAAQKAMRTVAYATAMDFLKIGLNFMPEDRWKSEYDLTFQLNLLSAEANYLLFNFDEASRIFDQILEYAKSVRDKVAVHMLKVKLYISSVNYKEAVNWGRSGLKLLNITLPTRHLKFHVIKELIKLRLKLFGKDTDTLANLPTITDPDQIDIISMLVNLVTPTYLTSKELFAFVIMKGMNFTLEHGNAPMTAYMYASYGIILNTLFEDFQGSYAFGKLGLELNKKFDDQKYAPATKFLVGTFLNPTKNHIKTSVEILEIGYEMGTSTGDFINAVFCQGMMATDKYLIGVNLEEQRPVIKEAMAYVAKIKSHNRGYVFNALRQSIMALTGETYNPSSMQTDDFNEDAFLQMLLDNNYLITLYFAYTFKMGLCYLFENYEQGIEIAKKAETISFSALGQPMALENGFYYALSLAANYSWKDRKTQKEYLKKIKKLHRKMENSAKASPSNYRHKYLLISAELARINGNNESAVEFYDEAIESAKENSYLQNEGIANELFAKFYLSQNRAHIAKQYLIESYYAFYRWGATAKLAQLEQKHAGVFSALTIKEFDRAESELNKKSDTTSGAFPFLDTMTVIKATQSISGEIVFERLLNRLMQIVVENAGAEKAILILHDENQWMVKAEYSTTSGFTKRPNISYKEKGRDLAIGVVNYVLHTKELTLIDEALTDPIFATDPYVVENKPQSILCFPLLHQAKLVGILYLENNLISRAFTPSRVEVLRLLTTQIATSLENSLLYSHQAELTGELQISNEKLEDYSHNLEKKVYDRTRELNEKNKLLEETLMQIKEMQKKLLHQEKVVSQVAVTKSIAQEMRTPLNYIGNFATLSEQLMEEVSDICKDKKAHETIDLVKMNLKKIHDHSAKADEIITSMLEQTQGNEGLRELTDLNGLIRNYADMVYYNYYKNDPLFSLTLETDYDPTIGKINVLPQNLGRVFYNLIDNACYATDKKKKEQIGNYSPIVSIRTENGDEFVTITIRDNGVGISKEIMARTFSPFVTTKPAGQSAGMGLSISHDIITQDHDGKIELRSEEGEFTEVKITLPKF